MCGLSAIAGRGWERSQLEAMVAAQRHRGPDDRGVYHDPGAVAGLGHNRLSILDLSPAGHQPMCSADGALWIAFNGEIYNYLELRAELGDYPYRSRTDTEVILAAYQRWGEACLDRLLGMFAFVIWDERERRLFAARDRFGIKPLYHHRNPEGTLLLASEIKALHAAGVPARFDAAAWATYLAHGLYDHCERTFWEGVLALPAGHALRWENDRTRTWCWYDLAERTGDDEDTRPVAVVQEEYGSLLAESVRLRFRSDVPVGINLSGGLDSSMLLGVVHAVQGPESAAQAFTFATGDPDYDELPWVRETLARTHHPWRVCYLRCQEVASLAESIQESCDEPYGGLPTLAYAKLFEHAREAGVIVLLDGQGMDEQWAGYDYYASALAGAKPGVVQGTKQSPVRPECLTSDFRALAEPFEAPRPFSDATRNLQYRDTRFTKIPRALRFNDRVSMRVGAELREPFMDHRLFELALRQPLERKILDGTGKWLPRQIARQLLPGGVVNAPKRPLQTPQREWLRGSLREWGAECINGALSTDGGTWLDSRAVRAAWREFCAGDGDSSFHIWQWISLALMTKIAGRKPASHPDAGGVPRIVPEDQQQPMSKR